MKTEYVVQGRVIGNRDELFWFDMRGFTDKKSAEKAISTLKEKRKKKEFRLVKRTDEVVG